ncbi:hypothetical protein PIB30_046167 [Stylosanthes scabra]|uniref:Reverse transcriptase n=1 Tax=Stylosanthes scabra TaxID=79078 RepID=A0ABU6VFF4_9FABA|nr:hypothetical protein [Stylosanthes scabra]
MEEGGSDHNHRRAETEHVEEEMMLLAVEDINERVRVCNKSLIGRMFADRVFSIGTMENAMAAIWGKPNDFCVTERGVQDKYLGLPYTIQRSKKATFAAIKEKVRKQVQGWKRRLLSSAGRHVLIKVMVKTLFNGCLLVASFMRDLVPSLEATFSSKIEDFPLEKSTRKALGSQHASSIPPFDFSNMSPLPAST